MKWVFFIFVALYAGALFLFAVGTYGWFGSDSGPLAGVFLVPLGLPWSLLADKAGWEGPLPIILAPAVNAAILYFLWKR